ncbi:hypothetical protein E4L95_12235 [Paracoccus liaowanqingii]|uniref:Uncharacterized protein n=1 Tax=Paracoccus liaowanqingii TaxID=2560053 RepID=A0A4Z1CA34_9RHOB|nr:hypothetical protein [Paracoccus liaowanqingii]TGN58610.1 hypothetical protein E4L95_12235 [Paracoccus liaowanqingii]
MNINIRFTADIGLTHWFIGTRNWEFTMCSRAYADDVLGSWDAGAVAYERDGAQRCLRLPFMAAFLVRGGNW